MLANKRSVSGALVQQLRALATLGEDPGSVPRTHMDIHENSVSIATAQFPECFYHLKEKTWDPYSYLICENQSLSSIYCV